MRQFLCVGDPVSQCAIVHTTLVLVAKPSVVHDEEFCAHFLHSVHHLEHPFFCDIQIDTFPRVEECLAQGCSVVDLVVQTSPSVITAAHASLAFFAVGKSQDGGGEGFTLAYGILGIGIVDACYQMMDFLVSRVDGKTEVSAPAENGTDGASAILLRLAIQRKHDVGTIEVGILVSCQIVDLKDSWSEGLFCNLCFSTPCTMFVTYPYLILSHGQIGAGVLQQGDRFLLLIVYLAPSFYDVTVVVGSVADVHQEVVLLVLHGDGVHSGIAFFGFGVRLVYQLRTHIAIGMLHA